MPQPPPILNYKTPPTSATRWATILSIRIAVISLLLDAAFLSPIVRSMNDASLMVTIILGASLPLLGFAFGLVGITRTRRTERLAVIGVAGSLAAEILFLAQVLHDVAITARC